MMMKPKTKRRLRWALIVLIVLVCVVITAASYLLVDYALNRQASFSMSNSWKKADPAELTEDEQWLLDVTADLYMDADGLKLHAYYAENPAANGRVAVLCHGYGSEGLGMVGFARHYYEQGYSLLIPDARAHGKSEGKFVGMGWPERKDVVRWIEDVVAHDPDVRIILHGISMGGATVMMVSGETLPSNVAAIVEDCGYSSVWDEFAWQAKQIFGIPEFPLIYTASMMSRLRAGYTFGEASAVAQVKKSVTPTLFIHGADDTFVPFAMLDVVYEAAACEKQKLVIDGAAHGMASSKEPELYWQTVDAFIEAHMN